jgi:hypothetical protein
LFGVQERLEAERTQEVSQEQAVGKERWGRKAETRQLHDWFLKCLPGGRVHPRGPWGGDALLLSAKVRVRVGKGKG